MDMDSDSANLSELEADMRVYARGAMAFALIPSGPPSLARLRVSPKTAPFAAP